LLYVLLAFVSHTPAHPLAYIAQLAEAARELEEQVSRGKARAASLEAALQTKDKELERYSKLVSSGHPYLDAGRKSRHMLVLLTTCHAEVKRFPSY
jgi:signal transduction histidine kinase